MFKSKMLSTKESQMIIGGAGYWQPQYGNDNWARWEYKNGPYGQCMRRPQGISGGKWENTPWQRVRATKNGGVAACDSNQK